MRFEPTPLDGAYLIHLERREDERGFFARAFCAKEFGEHGLETDYVQANLSHNTNAGIVRGMHYQKAPHQEVKLVRCVSGEIFDAIIDLREDSPTYRKWFGAKLSAENGALMHVPRGFAHGYQALTDGAMVHYMVSAYYAPDAEGGVHHADPAIGIEWPMPVSETSPKDAAIAMIGEGA